MHLFLIFYGFFVKVFDAYKAGTEAFRSNMARHGLSADKVDETMDDIQEVSWIFGKFFWNIKILGFLLWNIKFLGFSFEISKFWVHFKAINDHLDINEALARGSTSFTSIGSSDAELEDELADLLKETPKDDGKNTKFVHFYCIFLFIFAF